MPQIYAPIDDELAENARRGLLNGVDSMRVIDTRKSRVMRDAIENLAMRSPEAETKLDKMVRRLLELHAELAGGPGV